MVDLNLNNSRKRIKILGGGKYQMPTLGHQINATAGAQFQGGLLLAGYLETSDITVGNFSDKGASAPSTPVEITGMPNVEWSYLVNYNTDGDVAWVRTFEGLNGVAAQYNRCFINHVVYRPGDTAAYFTWISQARDVEVKDEDGSIVTTYTRPTNSGPGTRFAWFGGVTSINVETGAINWTTMADWDIPNTFDGENALRPQMLAWGGPDNDELVVAYNVSVQLQTGSGSIPKPVFGSTVQATHPVIDYARVTNSRVAGPWLVKINPENGDALSATSQVANFNDDIASSGTPNRGFASGDRFNTFNIMWNPVNELWYMSANHSGDGDFNVAGTILGNGAAGSISTRVIDNTGGNGSVKPYICTFNSDFVPQNVVTLACDTIDHGNTYYCYNHSVFMVPDGSGDVFWGWQNMSTSPLINLRRQGLLGNYGTGDYSITNNGANNSVIVRMDNDLEVSWEAVAFDGINSSLGRGHGINMVPTPNDSTKMLAMISTQGVNTSTNDTVSLFGSATVTFDQRQSFFVGFDITTGAFEDEREMRRAQSLDKMVGIGVDTHTSGPLQGYSFSSVLMSNDTNTTDQGFYDTAGVRQYTTSDYWNSNGAVYTQSNSGAIHLVAFDADGELDPNRCYPVIAFDDGSTAFNSWAFWTVPY